MNARKMGAHSGGLSLLDALCFTTCRASQSMMVRSSDVSLQCSSRFSLKLLLNTSMRVSIVERGFSRGGNA